MRMTYENAHMRYQEQMGKLRVEQEAEQLALRQKHGVADPACAQRTEQERQQQAFVEEKQRRIAQIKAKQQAAREQGRRQDGFNNGMT